ncbi:Pseudouridine synthase, RsuA/RluB/C/D/E/F [Ostreococcus tauri]|uniref:Pseudouridine synthase, RsuA/RluB/C/D/E/F n=1 Tax=Ostreococcus tauri TaxID=70448 RepID=A0A096P9L2_OSTTA|nr:Pseudouridine synthase, RsuA/RluB/C/D/E/F [Ostreococcus tauri]CEG01284.1 Pseudouridine synthase, RsuA/RluB/C/D/E/F [Ostreococcus tauri]|eukprot:XP_003075351.2 Pseudouridine synthase, RsuA/RluB/C/D/E/F [Ostreococcus tauri]
MSRASVRSFNAFVALARCARRRAHRPNVAVRADYSRSNARGGGESRRVERDDGRSDGRDRGSDGRGRSERSRVSPQRSSGFTSASNAFPEGLERVSKILARRGACSRREAEQLIADGRVRVNGTVITEQGHKCDVNSDRVEITSDGSAWLSSKLTLAVNKPPGLVSNLPSADEVAACSIVEPSNAWMRSMKWVAMDDLRRATSDPSRFNVCGRLDKDSRGLLILTEDGALARSVIGGNGVVKRYVVTTDADVRESHMQSLNGTVMLDGVELLPMNVKRLGRGSRTLEFNLREGKNRQIRRVCEKFGLRVVDLHRVQIGEIDIGDLPEGAWRILSEDEVASLRDAGR